MGLRKCYRVILLHLFVELSLSVYTPSVTVTRKPHLTPGIKTNGWRNSPSANILMHHNYSHVNYQNPNKGNALTLSEIYESTTKRVYPVYKPEEEQHFPPRNTPKPEEVTHQKVIVRVKKQLQTYEKCPPGMTGQLVYSLSCNQFLNCWKGRTFIQNCSPGTLFNPDTLSCDFPEKVRCITGPRRTIYEEPPPSYSHTLNTRQAQAKCPEEFSGTIPNYANCSKFIVCMQGKQMDQICPPGTLFDMNRNVCDFPKIAKCFNGENHDALSANVDYFVIRNPNKLSSKYHPSQPSYYQTLYPNPGSVQMCGDGGCPKPFATHPPDGGDTGFLQGNIQTTRPCPPTSNCNLVSSSNGQIDNPLYIETVNQPTPQIQSNQYPGCFPPNCSPNGKIDMPNTGCDPSDSTCRKNRVNNQRRRVPTPDSFGCNLYTLECVVPNNFIVTTPSYTSNRNIRINSNCNPRIANCGGPQNQINHLTQPPVKPPSSLSSTQGYGGGYHHGRVPILNQPEVKCPPGANGVHPHPYNCSLFLNCANGQTFVMNCGPGTLFNEQMMTCDFDYNVDCNQKGVTEPDGNDIRPHSTPKPTRRTTTTEFYDEYTTSFTYLTTDDNHLQKGHHITRTPKSQSFHRVSDYEDVGPGHRGFATSKPVQPIRNLDQNIIVDNKREVPKGPTKTWPPPYPATDTNADYVFEYLDVDMESELGAENAVKDAGNDCTKDTFTCGTSKCIKKDAICNGVQDCPDGRDEVGCSGFLKKFEVKKNKRLAVSENERWDNTTAASCAYLCLESKKFDCKSFNYRKIDNCCLLSDKNEAMTGRLMAYQPNDYYELRSAKLNCSGMFKCNNNKCIQKDQVCDGQDDCGEREDEKNCPADKIGYSIRLRGGKNPWEGRIEVSAFGRTGYICDDKFDLQDANVVCKELGYHLGAADIKGNSVYAKDVSPEKVFYMMDDVLCLGNETSIRDCDFNGWGSHDCTNTEVVGVVCNGLQDQCPDSFWKCKDTNECVPMAFVCDGPEDCSDGSDETDSLCMAPVEVRLVNGTTRSEGRIEVKYHDVWGSVCDDDFNDDAAKVVCKSLGYKGTVAVKKDAYFGEGKGPIWLDQVSCFGNETKLEKCSHWKWGEHNCDHSEDVGVICSESDTYDIERHVKNSENVVTPSVTPDPAYPIYPASCGLRKNSLLSADNSVHFRVVQGSKAKVGDFPWQAAIRVKGQLRVAHWCGAIIISSKFVLTAAHCLVGYPKGAYIVVAGDYNVAENEGTEQHAYIEDFYIHEDFRKDHKMNNDIALVKLKGQGFKLSQDVQAICLPEENTDYNIDLNCTISGFGSIESGVSAFSNELRSGEVPLLKDTVCRMPHVYGDSLTDGMFCAGYLDGGTDACDGDSGGPLACLDHGLFTLYGITSWGHRCGYANKPGVYVKVAHYKKWIDDIMRKNV